MRVKVFRNGCTANGQALAVGEGVSWEEFVATVREKAGIPASSEQLRVYLQDGVEIDDVDVLANNDIIVACLPGEPFVPLSFDDAGQEAPPLNKDYLDAQLQVLRRAVTDIDNTTKSINDTLAALDKSHDNSCLAIRRKFDEIEAHVAERKATLLKQVQDLKFSKASRLKDQKEGLEAKVPKSMASTILKSSETFRNGSEEDLRELQRVALVAAHALENFAVPAEPCESGTIEASFVAAPDFSTFGDVRDKNKSSGPLKKHAPVKMPEPPKPPSPPPPAAQEQPAAAAAATQATSPRGGSTPPEEASQAAQAATTSAPAAAAAGTATTPGEGGSGDAKTKTPATPVATATTSTSTLSSASSNTPAKSHLVVDGGPYHTNLIVAKPRTTDPAVSHFAFQWFRKEFDGPFRPVSGATTSSIQPTANDLHVLLQVQCTPILVEGGKGSPLVATVPVSMLQIAPAVSKAVETNVKNGEGVFDVKFVSGGPDSEQAHVGEDRVLVTTAKNLKVKKGSKTRLKYEFQKDTKVILDAVDHKLFSLQTDSATTFLFQAKDNVERDIIAITIRSYAAIHDAAKGRMQPHRVRSLDEWRKSAIDVE